MSRAELPPLPRHTGLRKLTLPMLGLVLLLPYSSLCCQSKLPSPRVPSMDRAGLIVVHSLSIVLLAFMEGYAIARRYARAGKYTLDINQVSGQTPRPQCSARNYLS